MNISWLYLIFIYSWPQFSYHRWREKTESIKCAHHYNFLTGKRPFLIPINLYICFNQKWTIVYKVALYLYILVVITRTVLPYDTDRLSETWCYIFILHLCELSFVCCKQNFFPFFCSVDSFCFLKKIPTCKLNSVL